MILPVSLALFAALLIYSGLNENSVTDSLRQLLGRPRQGDSSPLFHDLAAANAATTGTGSGAGGPGVSPNAFLNPFAPLTPNTPGSYVNPFSRAKNLAPERIDMGQDFAMQPGSYILAPGKSRVLGIVPNWFDGQPYLGLQLVDGPDAGKTYYLAEQINPLVKPGDTVAAGQPIATYAPVGTGIEMGWAGVKNWRSTLAQETTGYREGQETAAGISFHNFLQSLGVM